MPLNKPGRSGGILPYLFLYIPVVWAALLIAQSLGNGLPELLTNLTAALQTPLKIRWTEHSLMSILACTGAYIIGICLYCTTQGRTRDGEEHGSAQWASPKQVNAMFCQKQNKPLTQNVRLGLDTHKHRRSLNVLVIGGSGAAKTRSYVLPNILEANTNYVITDPKMEVLTATGGYLKSQGYDVRVLNLVNLEQSDGYNPFRYIRDEKDALRLVNNLIQATTPKNSHESDPFWTKAETALLQAIILMLFQEAPESEQNFSMVMRVLEYAEVKEDDEDHVSPLDLLFSAIEREKPDSVAVRQYKVFKMAAGGASANSLYPHVARAAGIGTELQNEKISILIQPFYQEGTAPIPVPDGVPAWMLYAALAGLGVFVILLMVVLLIRRRSKRRKKLDGVQTVQRAEEIPAPAPEGADIMDMKTEKSLELRRDVRKFAEENPEIAAQMVKNWLREGDDAG